MKNKLIIFALLTILALPTYANPLWSKAATFFFEYAAGKVVDYIWDKSTGKVDIEELQSRLDVLKQQIPEYKTPIQGVMSKVTPNMTREEFKEIVYSETNKLEERIKNNEIAIKDIDRKIDGLQNKIDEHSNDISTIKKELGIQKQSYEAFLSSYYNSVMSEPLMETYGKLSRNYQTKLPFSTYSAWWGKTVIDLSIVRSKKIDDSIFTVEIEYSLQDGSTKCSNDTIYLVKQNNKVMIDDVVSKDCY